MTKYKKEINRFLLFIIICFIGISKTSGQTDDSLSAPYEKFSNKAFGVNFFLGQGILSGNNSDYFTNPFYLGLNMEYYRKGLLIQFDDFIGFGKTKRLIDYTINDSWGSKKFVLSGMINLNIGYRVIDIRNLMIVPEVGIGFNKLSSGTIEFYDFTNELKPVLPQIKLGTYIDLKYFNLSSEGDSYACPRLSFGICIQMIKSKYDQIYGGNQIYITLGLGILGKIK